MAIVNQIMDMVRRLAEDENLRVTVNQSVRGGVIAGVATILGGLTMGPLGLMLGGAVGGGIAAATSSDFMPVHEVIARMHPHQREALAEQVRGIMNNVGAADAAVLAGMMAGDIALRQRVIGVIGDFLRNEMAMVMA